MTACPPPPNFPPGEVLDRLIDDVAWAKTCMIVAAATAPGSPAREDELEKLRQAVVGPRRTVDEVVGLGQVVTTAVLVDLRVCELAIPKLEAGAVLRSTPGSST